MGWLARSARPLLAAARTDDASDDDDDDAGPFAEHCCGRLVRVRDVAAAPAAALSLAAVVAGFCRRRVFALARDLPKTGPARGRRRRRRGGPVQADADAQRDRLALCQAFAGALAGLPYRFRRPRLVG